jgi:hypothetical protein
MIGTPVEFSRRVTKDKILRHADGRLMLLVLYLRFREREFITRGKERQLLHHHTRYTDRYMFFVLNIYFAKQILNIRCVVF